MKGDMALDYIFKVLITVVTIVVVIGLIITFSDDIKKAVNDFLCKITNSCIASKKFPKNIKQDSFTVGEVANYINDCRSTQIVIPENEQQDIVCYILFANKTFVSSGITNTSLTQALPPSIKDYIDVKTDFSHEYIRIQFQDLGNKIVVSE
jgi:hypothetical protein